MKYKASFIGTGNMGSALASAANKSGEKIVLSDIDLEKAKKKAKELGCDFSDTESAIKDSKFIFLGVKPQVLPSLLSSVKDILADKKDEYVLVSMAAGTPINAITTALGIECPVIRIMPNLPVSLGEGVILHSKNNLVNDSDVEEFCKLLQSGGKLIKMEEKMIDAASAVSGCGPAFVYMFIEALADGGVACGLTHKQALELASQTLIGASKMVLTSGEHPGKLRSDVCSPAGTTIEGVKVLEEKNFRAAAQDAVIAAYKRTKELAK